MGIYFKVQSDKEEGKRQEEDKANAKFAIIAGVFFGICGILTPMAIEKTQQNKQRVETYKQEQAEQDKLKAEQEAKQAALEAERKAQREAEEKERASHADDYVRTWCSRMRIITTDIDEQWEHWWPIATGSYDVVTEYDAANTLNLNLKQYLQSLDGNNYKIPEYASPAQKSQMNEIYKKLHDSLWKRIRASEQYAKGLKSGNFDLSEAEGIRRRAIEAEAIAAEASSLLKTLEGQMGL